MQMDLLDWTPPRKTIAFPLAKRVGKVRRCAEVLDGKHGRDADAYWSRIVRDLACHLEAIGCDRRHVA